MRHYHHLRRHRHHQVDGDTSSCPSKGEWGLTAVCVCKQISAKTFQKGKGKKKYYKRLSAEACC